MCSAFPGGFFVRIVFCRFCAFLVPFLRLTRAAGGQMSARMGAPHLAFTPRLKLEVRRALELLEGSGISLEEAARRAIVGRSAGARFSFGKVYDLFMRSRLDDCRASTFTWYEVKLAPFHLRWELRLMDSITREELREELAALTVSKATRAAHARAVRALWRWGAAQEPPLVGSDVTTGLRTSSPRGTGMRDDGVISVAACAEILAGAGACRSAIALGLFAGVRPDELAGKGKPRLLWRHINFPERFVRIPHDVAKTGKARALQNLPPTLWHWLTPGAPEAPVCPVSSAHLRRLIIRRLGRSIPFDGLRHTFASHAVALLGEIGPVSLWMGHEGRAALLHNTYLGLVTRADAVRFWALTPPETATARARLLALLVLRRRR